MKTTIFYFAILMVFLSTDIPKIYRSYKKIEKIEVEIASLDTNKKELLEELQELDENISKTEDLFFIEEIARDVHKMKKSGETIYRLMN